MIRMHKDAQDGNRVTFTVAENSYVKESLEPYRFKRWKWLQQLGCEECSL